MNTAVQAVGAASRTERTVRHKKNAAAQPRNWEDVNQRLGYLGEMERQLRSLRDQFEQKAAVLKQQWAEAAQPVAREKKKIEEQIECFYWAHREEVLEQGRKSVELALGRLGSRRTRRLAVDNAAAAQQWLKRHGLGHYLRVRTELDREALRSALLASEDGAIEPADGLLHCPGICLRDEEEFWYEAGVTRRAAEAQPAAASSAAPQDAGRSRMPPEAAAERARFSAAPAAGL